MIRTLTLTAAAAALALSLGGAAAAQKLDKAGRCHDAKGKFAAMSVCKGVAPATTHCRDVKTKKFAKCSAPGTEPVPVAGGQLDYSKPANSGHLPTQ